MLDDFLTLFRRRRTPVRKRRLAISERWPIGLNTMGGPIVTGRSDVMPRSLPRLDLDDGAVARMRDLSILYDRMGTGEFFQVFTRSINGMFFEIVERRDYDRYGEANAPVRLAAQAALDRSAAELLVELGG